MTTEQISNSRISKATFSKNTWKVVVRYNNVDYDFKFYGEGNENDDKILDIVYKMLLSFNIPGDPVNETIVVKETLTNSTPRLQK